MMRKFLGMTGLFLFTISILTPIITAEEPFEMDVNLLWPDQEGIIKVGGNLEVEILITNIRDAPIELREVYFTFELEEPRGLTDSYTSPSSSVERYDIYLPIGKKYVRYFPVVEGFGQDDLGPWKIYPTLNYSLIIQGDLIFNYSGREKKVGPISFEVLTEEAYNARLKEAERGLLDEIWGWLTSLPVLAIISIILGIIGVWLGWRRRRG